MENIKTGKQFSPRDEQERIFWERLEQADPAIQITLKRINRIAMAQFPDFGIQTSESCSGHTDKNGRLLKDTQPILFFNADTEENRRKAISFFRALFLEAVEATNKKMQFSAVDYGMPNKGPRFTASGNEITREGEYLSTPTAYNPSTGEAHSILSFSCEIQLLKQENADQILKTFWDSFDDALSKIDNLHLPNTRTKEAFVK